jgi:hypothetical protein
MAEGTNTMQKQNLKYLNQSMAKCPAQLSVRVKLLESTSSITIIINVLICERKRDEGPKMGMACSNMEATSFAQECFVETWKVCLEASLSI